MPLDYEKRYKAAYRENVKKRLVSPEKVKNFCKLHGFTINAVEEEIENNPIAAAYFAINPNRQKFHEKAAADFIKNLAGVEDFKSLPSNKWAVVNGAVQAKKDLKKSGGYPSAKTIDFQWKYNNATFYASHKYTKEEGGSQGNQYKDLQSFIEAARHTVLQNTYFVAIADGEFYRRKNGQANMIRLERLKQLAGGGKVYACDINGLEDIMKRATTQNRKA